MAGGAGFTGKGAGGWGGHCESEVLKEVGQSLEGFGGDEAWTSTGPTGSIIGAELRHHAPLMSSGSLPPCLVQYEVLCLYQLLEEGKKGGQEKIKQTQEASVGHNVMGQVRLSTETLGKLTSEMSLVTPETKPGKSVRGSVLMPKGKSESHGSGSQKQHHLHQSETTQISSSPLPVGPTHRWLGVSGSIGGETGLMSCVLPDELLVQILAERIQLSDCFRGVVFDGLDTLFARNAAAALLCLLKAIGNREHIYAVNMAQDYAAMKAQEKAKKEQEECKRREALEKEKERLQNMDEEEYAALTEEEKHIFDREVQQALQERKKRELERLAKEMQEKKLQQELERQKEEDELKRKIRKPKQVPVKEEPPLKKSQTASKQPPREVQRNEVAVPGPHPVMSDHCPLQVLDAAKQATVNMPPVSLKVDEARVFSQEHIALTTVKEDSLPGTLNRSHHHLPPVFTTPPKAGAPIIITIILEMRKLRLSAFLPLIKPDVKEAVERKVSAWESVMSEKEDVNKKKKNVADANVSGFPLAQEQEDTEGDIQKDTEKQLAQKFKIYELSLKDIQNILMCWDRKQGVLLLHSGMEDVSHEPDDQRQVPSGGRRGRKERERERLEKERLERERLERERLERERVERERLERLRAMEERSNGDGEGDEDHEGKKDLGVPFLNIQSPDFAGSSWKQALENDRLPKGDQAQEEQNSSPKGSRQKMKEKPEQIHETQKDKRRMAVNKKGLSAGTDGTIAPLSDTDQSNVSGQQSQEKIIRVNHFRWIVPANGEVTLQVHFSSNDLGNFDQTFNFEVLGTRRQYQLYCRGVCSYPYICQDPKVVFPQQKMDMKINEVIFKKYIMKMERFYFGPLLCGKSRDKYKSSLFPGNMETLTILNNSPLVVEAFFCFQNDFKATTYFLEPTNMILKPNEKQMLNVWAYPTAVGVFEDSIVCCIKENPEPAIFRLSCQGIRPELELEPKQLHFDRLLLHRKESKVVLLRNVTPLPVAWRISSLEHLGDDFTVSTMQGTIPATAEYSLHVHFQPSKPVNIKKAIRLEVLDAENLVGVVQIENIQIFAESYDVALDITFPKGAEGGLDFGIVRVMEEVKQPLQLKNRGKYEITFR
ncbi:PREDICTED: hydrocephalus-inducing protein homolog [Galeopterus variegatus]|uniref:Hydrocephalus-inducing protein homolog n=1 Tax=Galeopterus variegatus TaxID=482537 RepID=A0ABM0QYK3_GALVR|nr:PREDICTED: hydrocephalus-inducing protein homolog [Galeopterus variegatus]